MQHYRPIDTKDMSDTRSQRTTRRLNAAPETNLGTELVDLDFPVPAHDINNQFTAMTELDRRLLLSTADGDEDTVRMLLEKGARPNVTNAQSRSPLHLAGYRGYTDIVVLLLKRGAICGLSDSFGLTELHYALVNGHDNTAESLINHGASINVDVNDVDDNANTNTKDSTTDIKIMGEEQTTIETKRNTSIHHTGASSFESLRNKAIVATNAALSRHANERNGGSTASLSPTPCKSSKLEIFAVTLYSMAHSTMVLAISAGE